MGLILLIYEKTEMHMKVLIIFLIFILTISPQVVAQQLNPGDGVRITFFNITDEISGDYFIQQGGFIQLPFIGLVRALERKFESIKTEIVTKYDSLYRNPELTVQPLYKISVLGEVRTPGIYYATGVEKIIDLLALAGGETIDADADQIYILRENEEIKVDMENINQAENTISDIGVQSGDRIFVPRKWWVGARNAGIIIAAAGVIVTLVSILVR